MIELRGLAGQKNGIGVQEKIEQHSANCFPRQAIHSSSRTRCWRPCLRHGRSRGNPTVEFKMPLEKSPWP